MPTPRRSIVAERVVDPISTDGLMTSPPVCWVGMDIRRFQDVDAYLEAAGPFLVAREAEHNLIFGICSSLRETPERYGEPYLAVVDRDDTVVAAAIQTPPFRLVLSEVDDPSAIDALVEDTLDRTLPGVTGPAERVGVFAATWNVRGGPTATLAMS